MSILSSATSNYYTKNILFYMMLLFIAFMCTQYKKTVRNGEILDEHDLIQKYLLHDQDYDTIFNKKNAKPILWIHIEYDVNSRKWLNYGSRNTTELNQPYLYLTIRSIIQKCSDSFHICLIDDSSFNKLLPNWTLQAQNLPRPLRPHLRELAFAKVLEMYGGMRIPPSFICFKNLFSIYDTALLPASMFVGEMLATSSVSTLAEFFPSTEIMGCKRNSPIMKKYISYIEVLISKDYTNEMDFLGECGRWCYSEIINGNMSAITSTLFGIQSQTGNAILIEDLIGDQDVDLDKNAVGLYIPERELLKRIAFGWFIRLSPQQVLESNTLIGKYLLYSNS
jgi:hypothetical protein